MRKLIVDTLAAWHCIVFYDSHSFKKKHATQDLDIAGTFDKMLPDAEGVRMVAEVMSQLDLGEFKVKINHRQLLDGMFEVCGVPADKIRCVSSSIDKLDKTEWSEVRRELVAEKGIDGQVADQIGEYAKLSG